MQVHYAAQSHFASNSQAWGENSQNTTSPIPPAPPPNFHGYLLCGCSYCSRFK
jgi:hypothetical protein